MGGLVVPDGGGEGEESLQDADGDAGGGAPAVAFEAELGFEGPEDRFDDLAERPQVRPARSGGFCFDDGADQGDGRVVELLLEGGAAVALIRDEGPAPTGQVAVSSGSSGELSAGSGPDGPGRRG